MSILSDEARDAIFEEVFSSDKGNFSLCRMPIGANDFALIRYSLNDTAGDYDMVNFTLERDEKYLIPYIMEAMKNQS